MLGEKNKEQEKKERKHAEVNHLIGNTPLEGQVPMEWDRGQQGVSPLKWAQLPYLEYVGAYDFIFSKYDGFMFMYCMRPKSKRKIHSYRRQLTHKAWKSLHAAFWVRLSCLFVWFYIGDGGLFRAICSSFLLFCFGFFFYFFFLKL